jgi:hypothetical protein
VDAAPRRHRGVSVTHAPSRSRPLPVTHPRCPRSAPPVRQPMQGACDTSRRTRARRPIAGDDRQTPCQHCARSPQRLAPTGCATSAAPSAKCVQNVWRRTVRRASVAWKSCGCRVARDDPGDVAHGQRPGRMAGARQRDEQRRPRGGRHARRCRSWWCGCRRGQRARGSRRSRRRRSSWAQVGRARTQLATASSAACSSGMRRRRPRLPRRTVTHHGVECAIAWRSRA